MTNSTSRLIYLLSSAMACVVVWWAQAGDGSKQQTLPKPDGKPVDMPGLHNVIRVSDKLYSGSSPDGDAGFESLKNLGIKTAISVDGAKPNIEAAKKAGLRYVHIPIGYNGVPHDRVLQLARAMHELPGPFYVHCHHGKHRGPAAAAVARLCADEKCTVADALQLLKSAGTDPRYKGLFESVEKLARPKENEWKNAAPLVDVVRVAMFTQAMVTIDQHLDHLKLARTAGWQTPKGHPDIDPAHEALQLLEQYRELRRQPAIKKKPADFQDWLRDGEVAAGDVEQLLRTAKRDKKLDTVALEKAFVRAGGTCTACHGKYRD